MDNETVREVCAEMNELSSKNNLMWSPQKYLSAYADRIIAAHQRELAAKDEMAHITAQSAQARFDDTLAAKDAEIAKHERCYQSLQSHCKKLEDEYLRATNALKPVLECITDWGDVVGECSCRERIETVHHACHNAVREAKKIWSLRDSSENARGLDGEVGR